MKYNFVLEEYADEKYNVDIDNLPRQVILDACKEGKHLVIDEYVYGLKMVTKECQDMFGVNTYEKEKTYIMEDSDQEDNKFACVFIDPCVGIHTAGLWSFRCDIEMLERELEMQKNTAQCRPIIVRYKITDVLPIREQLKGRVMEVVETGDLETIRAFIISSRAQRC